MGEIDVLWLKNLGKPLKNEKNQYFQYKLTTPSRQSEKIGGVCSLT